jgi:Replication protein
LYGNNQICQSQSERQARVRHPDGSRGCGAVSSEASLVKYTDNSSILTQQGFQRLRDRFKLLNSTRKLLKGERTQYCFFNRVDKNDGVGVLFNKYRNKANYSNIMRCANAWGCPVCAAIISEHRKTEVKEAIDWWKAQGGSVLLLTLTVPHYSHTDIKKLKTDLKKAYSKFFKGTRASQTLFSKWRIQHYISCFEITHGENGFHPHYHILLFVPYSLGITNHADMENEMYDVWKDCCLKAGLDEPSRKHGLHLQAGNHAGKYVAKWGLEHEMTKGHIKKGKKDSRTPFDILRSYAETEDETEANLFRLYYFAFKGQRQLNWSRSLKKLCRQVEKSDQEIVDDTDNVAEMLFKLDIELWNAVRSQGKQGELLIAVTEDQTLKKPMELVRQCMINQGLLERINTSLLRL